jgi:hypothetical protein
MVYKGTDNIEIIQVHPMDNLSETHFISLVKPANSPTFYVTCCCNEDWGYEFYLENNSDYERIKFNIMETIFEAETMNDLLETLSEVFEDGFSDIMVENCDCEDCNCCCEE